MRQKREEQDKAHAIPRIDGVAYLTVLRGEKVLADDDIYMTMYRNKMSVAKDGYPRFSNRPLHLSVITEAYNTRTHHTDLCNGNKLDNRRENLRTVSIKVNAMNVTRKNATGYTGVQKTADGKFMGYVDNHKVTPIKRYYKTFARVQDAYIWLCTLRKKIYPELYV